MSSEKDTNRNPNPPSARPLGSALPEVDGYYWMHNIGSEGQHIWRIVDIGFWADGECRALRRGIRDGQRVYSMAYIAPWMGLEFYGPLAPPNPKVSDGRGGHSLNRLVSALAQDMPTGTKRSK